MNKHTNNENHSNITIAEQKAMYEEQKEQERKRRFAILSGHIKPIQISFTLKTGEHAYYQIEAEQKAEREYVESHTTGDVRRPFIKGGILRGNSKVNTTTTQSHSSGSTTVDSGKLLFTNVRVLFIGKQVISISYADILSVQFTNNSVVIKYPQMAKGESYSLPQDNDAKYYYYGVLRLIGIDKTKANEADVDMSRYPLFVSDEAKEAKKKHALLKKIFFWVGIFLCMVIFLRGIIVIVNWILVGVIVMFGIGYVVSLAKNRIELEQYEGDMWVAKKVLLYSSLLLLIGVIIAAAK